MFLLSFKIALPIVLTFALLNNCNNNSIENKSGTSDTTSIDSSTNLFVNLKKTRPGFDLKLDSVTDTSIYSKTTYPDTTACTSFRFDRLFLGKLDGVKAYAQPVSAENSTIFLQSGTLKLWTCNLPETIRIGDTLLISGLVFDILGNERAYGLPTILTKVSTRF